MNDGAEPTSPGAVAARARFNGNVWQKGNMATARLTRFLLIAMLIAFGGLGCSTIGTKTNRYAEIHGFGYSSAWGYPYSGTRCNLVYLNLGTMLYAPPLIVIVPVDLVFSLIADTLVLPIDLLSTPSGPWKPESHELSGDFASRIVNFH